MKFDLLINRFDQFIHSSILIAIYMILHHCSVVLFHLVIGIFQAKLSIKKIDNKSSVHHKIVPIMNIDFDSLVAQICSFNIKQLHIYVPFNI